MFLSPEDLEKVQEITRLHDEAFDHYQQFDGHAKSGDGWLSIEMDFGTRWDRRRDGKTTPKLTVHLYSYVVATESPMYPNFDGSRNYEFATLDEALEVMQDWHKMAMDFNPGPDYVAENDEYFNKLWDIIKEKIEVIEIDPDTAPE
jgi:hypothetical protein